jgi:hypothetical protein
MFLKDNFKQPFNNKPIFIQISLIALTILGFESVTFLSSNYGENSQVFSIAYRIIYLLLGLIVIRKFYLKVKVTIFNKSVLIIMVFWLLYLLRALYDTGFDSVTDRSPTLEFWAFIMFLCFMPIFPLIIPINFATLNYAKKAVFSLAILVNILGLINNLKNVSNTGTVRLNANEVLNAITYGQTGVILIIMAFTSISKKNIKFIYFNLIFILLGLSNVALAASRGPVIELLVVLIFYIILNYKRNRYSSLFIVGIVLFALSTIFTGYLYIFNSVIERIISTNGQEDRPLLFAESWQRFVANPVLGNRAISEWAHNIFLGSLEVLGIIGGILMLIIYKNALKECVALVKIKSTDWIALLLMMQLVGSLMSGAIWNAIPFWPLLGLISNLYYHRYLYNQKDQTSNKKKLPYVTPFRNKIITAIN